MELVALLVVGLVLGIPIVAVVALVRTRRLRESLDERFGEQTQRIFDLETQVSGLRRDLERMQRLHETSPATSGLPTPEPQPAATASVVEPIRAEAATPLPAAELDETSPAAPLPELVSSQSARPPLAAFEISTEAPTIQTPMPTEAAVPAVPAQAQSTPTIPETPMPAFSESTAPPVSPFASAAPADGTPMFEIGSRHKTIAERLRSALPLEEVLGMNLFAKIGIILLVLGFALLGRVALVSMGPAERVALIYAVTGVMLGGGIWLERKVRYQLVGRTGIGGGWALLFFTTYAMSHVPAMTVLQSNTLDCVLLLLVAVAMVGHTLRYRSQLVTGLAFLLAFSTVALSQDTVYSLAAGVILAIGLVVIALRMSWFELEVFGILASFANHFYWLYKLYPDGVAGHAFPQFWPSATILILYWAIFRVSYIVRRIQAPRDETISTIAALLNSVLLLAVMKFQSTRPELAFYALLALGAIEFSFGQLALTRRRRPAFILLSVLGTILIFASAPFKFSGNNIALLWMTTAEVLLIAGIVQAEVVFRRLGLVGGLLTGLVVLYSARQIVELRQTVQAPLTTDGILLLAASVFFYCNAHLLLPRWKELFAGRDRTLAIAHGHLGGATAFLGIWAIFTGDWTAVGWVALMLAATCGKRYLADDHLLMQAWALVAAVLAVTFTQNLHLSDPYPHHVLARLLTLPILALGFYCATWALSGIGELRSYLRTVSLWSGSALLASLVWLEIKPTWVAPVWVALAVVLSVIGRRFRLADLMHQEHALVVLALAQLAAVNLDSQTAIERYIPFLSCAVALYAISRFSTLPQAAYAKPAAWAHTWVATALVAALAWHESPQPWLAVVWVAFALGLALTDRVFDVEELPGQAHLLAFLAVLRAVTLNLQSEEQWHGVDLRLITVSILIAVLYAMARWVRLPKSFKDANARHAYTWIASALFAWMLWGELQPVGVALGLALLGLALFEFGHWCNLKQIRLQGYAALTAGFVRIFFVNLTAAALPGEAVSPRIYTVAPIALIYFFVWTQLQSKRATLENDQWSPTDLIAYLGTVSVAALLYFQMQPEWIVLAWAILAVLLLVVSLLLNKELFLHQAELLIAGIVARAVEHNIIGGSYFAGDGWRGSAGVLSLASGLLLLALPLAFRLRARYALRPAPSTLVSKLALRHPEQIFFFAPVLLISLMIAVKMNPGMVTLTWGVEGLAVILLGLFVGQRTYRITGLLLLLLCVGKIVVRDAWQLDERDRYITFIALGTALTLVSMLYGKYRETVRRLL